jgi:hypothetical protein
MTDAPLRVGDVLDGFCDGWFGRDSYGKKYVEAIGADWVVCRENGRPVCGEGPPENLVKHRQ